MTTFFVYINYMHVVWSTVVCNLFCVCYRCTRVRVLLWPITEATQRSLPFKLSAAIIMTTPVIATTN